MAARLFLLLYGCITCSLLSAINPDPTPYPAGTKILHRVISLDVKSIALERVLRIIEQKAYFKFSYNADIIEENKLITLKIENKAISVVLKQLFNESIRYKEAGNHLILLKNNSTSEQIEKPKDGYYFTGKITDSETGKPISGASIYDVEARQASISDDAGNYHMMLQSGEVMRGFYFSKTGYFDTTLVIVATVSLQNNIALIPLESELAKLPGTDMQRIETPIEERPFSKSLIPEETFIHSENLKAIHETRIAQISFLPSLGIGSDLSTNGLMINHFSLNVLAGYANGVHGCEIGGIVNLIKNDVTGCQVGGIGNLVGGKIYGAQVGGISNVVLNDVLGVQVSGINNLVRGHVNGVQVGGISNMIVGGFNGVQIAGINNFARRSSHGVQIAGINNVVVDTLYGGQIAGIGNWARRGITQFQIAGFANIAHKNQGAQIGAFYNYCSVNDGIQIGLVNSSVSGKGVGIGIVNFCQEGYRSTEISMNEVFPINLTFKTGVTKLYNTYTFGVYISDRPRYGFGMGLGNKTFLTKRLSLSTEANAYLIQLTNFNQFQGNHFFRISTTLDIRLAKWFTVFIGPNFNFGFSRYKTPEGNFETFINYDPKRGDSDIDDDSQYQTWTGAQVGIRFGIDRSTH